MTLSELSDKPRPKKLIDWIWLFFCGFCMGLADLVPGISAGTVALILAIYDDFIASLCTFNIQTIKHLINYRFRQIFHQIAWEYLTSLISGMGIAIFIFSPLFHFFLNHLVFRCYLFALFSGLILASSFLCALQLPKWKNSNFNFFIVGIFLAILTAYIPQVDYNFTHFSISVYCWIFFSGSIAVAAMLLPGISGSYILAILNVYPIVIASLASASLSAIKFSVDWISLSILSALGLGILFGAACFSRIIKWLLLHYRTNTLALLIGFMVGALKSIWPFWTYKNIIFQNRVLLSPVEPYMPTIYDTTFWIATLLFLIGFTTVMFFQAISFKNTWKLNISTLYLNMFNCYDLLK